MRFDAAVTLAAAASAAALAGAAAGTAALAAGGAEDEERLISGPVTAELLEFDGRRFLFLGDCHESSDGRCPGDRIAVQEWLPRALRRGPVDLFLEEVAEEGFDSRPAVDSIEEVHNAFRDCLSPNLEVRAACAARHAPSRVHFVDHVRKGLGTEPDRLDQAASGGGGATRIAKRLRVRSFQDMLDVLESRRDPRTIKQMDAMDAGMRARLLAGYHVAVEHIRRSLGAEFDRALAAALGGALAGGGDEEAVLIMQEAVLDVCTLEMDLYALARMFRTFADGTRAGDVAVYAGATHARRYALFVATLPGARSLETGELVHGERCIRVGPATWAFPER